MVSPVRMWRWFGFSILLWCIQCRGDVDHSTAPSHHGDAVSTIEEAYAAFVDSYNQCAAGDYWQCRQSSSLNLEEHAHHLPSLVLVSPHIQATIMYSYLSQYHKCKTERDLAQLFANAWESTGQLTQAYRIIRSFPQWEMDHIMQWKEARLRPWAPHSAPECQTLSMNTHTPFACCFSPPLASHSDDLSLSIDHNDTHRRPLAGMDWPSGKRVAVVFRGHVARDLSFTTTKSGGISRTPDNDSRVTNFLELWNHTYEMVIRSLEDAGAEVTPYLSVHTSDLDAAAIAAVKPYRHWIETDPTARQGSQIAQGMEMVDQDHQEGSRAPYDFIFLLRLDTVYKIPARQWPVAPNYINVPFRSINDHPDSCSCQVTDVLIGYPPSLTDRVRRHCGLQHEHCHGLGGDFSDMHLWDRERCFDSNTARPRDPRGVSRNPFFVLYGREYDYGDIDGHSPGKRLRVPHVTGL